MSTYNLGRVLPIFRGLYDNTEIYNRFDVVYVAGMGSYVALQDVQGIKPTVDVDDNWQVLVKDITTPEVQDYVDSWLDTMTGIIWSDLNNYQNAFNQWRNMYSQAVSKEMAKIAPAIAEMNATVDEKLNTIETNVDAKLQEQQQELEQAKENINRTVNSAVESINADNQKFQDKLKADVQKYINDENIVRDANYVHTDNNFTDADKAKINTPVDLSSKQDKLVSGSNIKTINGASILGSGDIEIKGGGGSGDTYTKEEIDEKLEQKANTDGFYEDMTVGWTLGIISPDNTVTNDDYVFRTTGGELNIETGDASITTIKGRTMVMNSKLFQGDFPTNPTYWTNYNTANNSFTVADGVATCKKNTYSQDSNILIYNQSVSTAKAAVLTIGHVYYFKAFVQTDAPAGMIKYGMMNRSGNADNMGFTTNVATPNWQLLSYTTPFKWTTLQPFWGIADMRTANFTDVKIKNVSVIDLTVAFGAGNEPSKEVCDSIFSNEFYPRQANQNITTKITGFKTTGFNQINEASIIKEYYLWGNSTTPIRGTACWVTRYTDVIGGATYHFSHPFDPANYTARTPMLYIFDSAKNLISYNTRIEMECDITLPQNARYIRVSAYVIQWTSKSWFNMNFKWSGVRDGEHETYTESTIDFTPIMNQYFPNGLQSNGAVYDEITSTQIIKRIGDDGTVLTTPITEPHGYNLTYVANDFGTEQWLFADNAQILPVQTQNSYIRNLRDIIRNIDGNTDSGALMNKSLDNLLQTFSNALGYTITKTWNDNKKCWEFSMTKQ